jgi:hypothetical protein
MRDILAALKPSLKNTQGFSFHLMDQVSKTQILYYGKRVNVDVNVNVHVTITRMQNYTAVQRFLIYSSKMLQTSNNYN